MRLCVFCGSSNGTDPRYAKVARELGRTLAEHGIGVVYGGAAVGTMGALADGALDAGGEVIGVLPDHLTTAEVAHRGLTSLRQVPDMHTRKATMGELADGFLVLPGGIGTLEEFFEVWTWAQLRLHAKPIGLVDVDGFFDRLLAFADQLVTEGFLRPDHRAMVRVAADPKVLIDEFARYTPPGGKFD